MKKLALYGFIVDLLILFVLCLTMWPSKPVQAQLAASSGFSFTHITTATNTQSKSSNGTLHNVTVNTTAAGAVTVVDTSAANCSGGTTIAVLPSSATVGDYAYDIQFQNGLCVTTGAASDLTISWR